jgi:hypothetical protein
MLKHKRQFIRKNREQQINHKKEAKRIVIWMKM